MNAPDTLEIPNDPIVDGPPAPAGEFLRLMSMAFAAQDMADERLPKEEREHAADLWRKYERL